MLFAGRSDVMQQLAAQSTSRGEANDAEFIPDQLSATAETIAGDDGKVQVNHTPRP